MYSLLTKKFCLGITVFRFKWFTSSKSFIHLLLSFFSSPSLITQYLLGNGTGFSSHPTFDVSLSFPFKISSRKIGCSSSGGKWGAPRSKDVIEVIS